MDWVEKNLLAVAAWTPQSAASAMSALACFRGGHLDSATLFLAASPQGTDGKHGYNNNSHAVQGLLLTVTHLPPAPLPPTEWWLSIIETTCQLEAQPHVCRVLYSMLTALRVVKRLILLRTLSETVAPALVSQLYDAKRANSGLLAVVNLLLLGSQDSPKAFHTCLPRLAHVLRSHTHDALNAQEKPTEHKAAAGIAQLLHRLIAAFPGYSLLYAPLEGLLEPFPRQENDGMQCAQSVATTHAPTRASMTPVVLAPPPQPP